MKRFCYHILLCVFPVVLFISCSEKADQNSNLVGSAPLKKSYIISAELGVFPNLDLYGYIKALDENINEIDSIKIADSLCTLSRIERPDSLFTFRYKNTADSIRYKTMDSLRLDIYYKDEIISQTMPILRMPDDSVHVISYPDSLPLEGSGYFSWRKVPNADWYQVSTIFAYFLNDFDIYFKDAAYTRIYENFRLYADSTYNGESITVIRAVIGPKPDDPYNLNGTTIQGYFRSMTNPTGIKTIIGSGYN